MKTCTKCNGEFSVDQFPKRYDSRYPEARKTWCKSCENKRGRKKPNHNRSTNQTRKKRIASLRKQAFEHMGGKCSNPDCPISHLNLPVGAFDYHHVDPSSKKFGLSDLIKRSIAWPNIQAELDKCVMLCCLCHRLEHLS